MTPPLSPPSLTHRYPTGPQGPRGTPFAAHSEWPWQPCHGMLVVMQVLVVLNLWRHMHACPSPPPPLCPHTYTLAVPCCAALGADLGDDYTRSPDGSDSTGSEEEEEEEEEEGDYDEDDDAAEVDEEEECVAGTRSWAPHEKLQQELDELKEKLTAQTGVNQICAGP